MDSAFPRFELTIDGTKSLVAISRSVGAFSAGGPTNDGVYLDALEWIEATTDWGPVQ